jgi:hypothetical protein
MMLELDSGLLTHLELNCENWLNFRLGELLTGYAAVPQNGNTLPPRCVRSRKSAQSCIILARGSR